LWIHHSPTTAPLSPLTCFLPDLPTKQGAQNMAATKRCAIHEHSSSGENAGDK